MKDGSRVRLISRTGIDHATRFPDVADAVAKLPAHTLILDGELAAFDRNLVSHIQLLDAAADEVCTRPVLIAFDCLFARGKDLRPTPLTFRRAALEDEIAGARFVLPARRLADNGIEAWEEVKRRNLEGLVAKRADSIYRGGRTRDWCKVKIRREGRFLVIGLAISDGAPSGLLVAAREERRLVWVGTVEWGVGRKTFEAVLAKAKRVVVPACEGVERRGCGSRRPLLSTCRLARRGRGGCAIRCCVERRLPVVDRTEQVGLRSPAR